MVVVGRLRGAFAPTLVIVAMAQTNSAPARTTTAAPSKPAGRVAGRNGRGASQFQRTADAGREHTCKRWSNS
jgi:hypothetical protein